MSETLFELERATNRTDLAALLAELSDALEDDRPAILGSGERTVEIDVPRRTVLEIELERAEEPPTIELEFELEWDDRPEEPTVRVVETDAETAVGGEDAAATLQSELESEPVDEQLVDEGPVDREPDDADAGSASDAETAAEAEPSDRGATDDASVSGESTGAGEAEDAAEGDGNGEDDEEPQRSTPSPASSVAPPDAVAESDAVTDEPVEGGADDRRSRFEVYQDRAGEWRWRLVHWNGNVIADSGEGYASRRNAERGLRSVMRNAPEAGIDRLE